MWRYVAIWWPRRVLGYLFHIFLIFLIINMEVCGHLMAQVAK